MHQSHGTPPDLTVDSDTLCRLSDLVEKQKDPTETQSVPVVLEESGGLGTSGEHIHLNVVPDMQQNDGVSTSRCLHVSQGRDQTLLR